MNKRNRTRSDGVCGQHRQTPDWPALSLVIHADGRAVTFDRIGSAAAYDRCSEGYRLRAHGKESVHITVHRTDGNEMDVDHLEVRFTVPLRNFSKVILPDSGREYVFKDKALLLRSQVSALGAANDGHPFVALVDQTGGVVASYGLIGFLRETTCRCVDPKLSARKAMRGGHDVLTLSFRLPSEGWRYGKVRQIRETVFRQRRAMSWFHALRRYTRLCQRFHRVAYPVSKRAMEPTWCTWTAWCSDRLSDETVLANARIARDLGIRSVILDDGWFGPGLDTDDRPLNIGDYEPDPAKFPDLKGLVGQLHDLGMDVLLWVAPTCISPDSRSFARLADQVMEWKSAKVLAPNGFHNLCPCHPGVRAHVRAEIARMLRDYDVDGFKVDLFNTLPVTPCDAGHEHDCTSVVEGLHRLMADAWTTLRRIRPHGVIELKQNYANVLSAQYGTMVRAGDTAYDIDTNLRRCAYIQAYAPVTHNDYLACSVHDTPRDIAVMMIKLITGGVPTFSMDLVRQPEANREVIRAWLDFYRENLDLWRRPREPLDGSLDVWRMGGRRKVILSALLAACEIPLPEGDEILILNATGRDRLYLRTDKAWTAQATWRDYALRPHGVARLRVRDGMRVHVPVGGALRLRRPQGPGGSPA